VRICLVYPSSPYFSPPVIFVVEDPYIGGFASAPYLLVLAAGGAALGADHRREGAADRDLGDHSLAGGPVVWRHLEHVHVCGA
jgi:hypothetical protein